MKQLKTHLAAPWRRENGSLVAPVTMVVPGVMCGSAGCLLHKEEVVKASAGLWEAAPLTLGHPQDAQGNFISVQEAPSYTIGKIRNPRFRDGALRAEAVVTHRDPAVQELVQQVKEISVGVYTEDAQTAGQYQGKQYDAVVKLYRRADHVALLVDQTGACSWQDGCGVRVHKERMEVGMHQHDCLNCPHGDACEAADMLYPVGVVLPKPKFNLRALQAEADAEDILMPAQYNRSLDRPTRKADDDGDDEEDILLPRTF